ncbi:MAG: hypothetical protein ACOYMN_13965 [Roseimicrobium sp.]
MNFRKLVAPVICSLAFVAVSHGESLPADHPTGALVKKYLEAVVKQDWKTAADMLAPVSLERRRAQMVAAVKNSPTMTEEAAKLSLLGVKDIKDLEKMTPQEAYVADRDAVHKRMKVSPESIKKKQETLVIDILGLISEKAGSVVHALVRTKQDTAEVSIEELLLISLTQEKDKWLIVPDMQQPVTVPLKK